MGSGTWTCAASASGDGWNFSGGTVTLDAGTSTLSLSSAGGNAHTFSGGSLVYNNLSITGGGAGAWTFSGSNTFNTFTTNAPKTVKFTSGTTQTISSFVATGSSGNTIPISSSSGGSLATLSDSSGANQVRYCSIQDITATGGALWYARDNCTNVSGNSGWIFKKRVMTAN